MADSEGQESACSARIELSHLVPDGRAMVPVDRATETVLVVREGMMDPVLVDEWNQYLDAVTHTGRWRRSDCPLEPPKGHPNEE